MKVYEAGEPYTEKGPVAIGLGNFDGVHVGHASLLESLKEEAEKAGVPSAVYTFRTHPMKVLCGCGGPKLIMSEKTKLSVLAEKGIDVTYLEDFTAEYAKMTPYEFIEKILVNKFKAVSVVVGEDFSFGCGGKGNTETLMKYASETGKFNVRVVELVKIDGKTVSSTAIREEIRKGNMEKYTQYTGRRYVLPGRVTEGRKVGRTIGFPTANIIPDNSFAIPSDGVYYTVTEAEGNSYRSLTNIGSNPTFGCDSKTIETHLLDFEGDLYGKEIEVSFICKIRDEKKFSGPEELKKQIKRDMEYVRRF